MTCRHTTPLRCVAAVALTAFAWSYPQRGQAAVPGSGLPAASVATFAARARAAARSAPQPDETGGRDANTSPPPTDTSDGNRKISLDSDFVIEGKLEKPNAFYILRRSQSDYDWARLDAKFLPLVLESVQDPLF